MDNEKMAQFILELRKEKKMTQKELAERLGITDKAVSKWERGLSCPDISLLSGLAEILGVTTGELLHGRRAAEPAAEISAIVETTLTYADVSSRKKVKNIKMLSAVIISALFFIGIAVCVICDLAITGTLTWSWYPICSVVFAWLMIIPAMISGKKGMRNSLLALTVFLIPYLVCINRLLETSRLFLPLGILISLPSLIYVWMTYYLLVKTRLWPYVQWAMIVSGGIIVGLIVSFILSVYLNQPILDAWDILAYSAMIILSFIILLFGYQAKKSFRRK